ncbi:hypothetical protein GQ43DRAFT_272739 [Delitschia confertaspora ATCC 74209]|uniref:C2H2-type domain-containing protein n=1 Tax=Delitschia confertaspora ATCC 74209 TaxID=1513339 RepID=A0A9P4JVJ5_9PLEO|nr:hypothetical protein GQ43DRAFT_272739 [Delitschia confertaspora ATCC 74209]
MITTTGCSNLINPVDPSLQDSSNTASIVGSTFEDKPFFCTFCYEAGDSSRRFKKKSDWKRHETRHHETREEYRCPASNCCEAFPREEESMKHFDIHHKGDARPAIVKVLLSEKFAYGCGFCEVSLHKMSSRGTSSWDKRWNERCDHVAKCMLEGLQWTFTNTIRELLKQPNAHEWWKELCHRYGIHRSTLKWHLKASTRLLRQQLECNDFNPYLQSFLENAFELRTQNSKGHMRLNIHMAQPTYGLLSSQTSVNNSALAQPPLNGLSPPNGLPPQYFGEFEQENGIMWGPVEDVAPIREGVAPMGEGVAPMRMGLYYPSLYYPI